jgi:hypothetical protein
MTTRWSLLLDTFQDEIFQDNLPLEPTFKKERQVIAFLLHKAHLRMGGKRAVLEQQGLARA